MSRASYVAGLLRPVVIRELRLADHGLELLPRDPASFTPEPDGPGLLLGPDRAANCAEIRRYSPRDAQRYPEYERLLERVAVTLEPWLDAPPPRSVAHALPLLAAGASRLGRALPRAWRLLRGAAGPILEAWFESEPLRATLATDAIIGAWAGPSSPGSGYVLLHHVMGETGGRRGAWAYARGGMGAISAALASAARAAGATIRCEAPVARIRTRHGRVVGVTLANGEEIDAPVVVANPDPRRTLLDLVGASALPRSLREGLEALDFRSPVMKINVALDRLPVFRRRPRNGAYLRGTIHLGASTLAELEASFAAARAGHLPERPMIELTIPSVIDQTLAPPGRHVASLFVQHVPYAPAGGDWEQLREAFAERVFALVDEHAPGFSASILHRDVLAPPDLERVFGISGGNIFHGAMSPDRLWWRRPLPGLGRYATPIRGLYLCGAGTHPGGGVMGACGRNAATAILSGG
ncbi:MAG: NAD(P)/FAD-dependent oxidoreductase [Gammaproteobacteria bacterium]|nr:MAG: NAD(P)/FAD-dependent oxidoreductase [Gammaproteobacteria bacterium]